MRVFSPVVAELYYGCQRSSRQTANKAQVDAFLKPMISVPFDDAAAELFAQIRFDLESKGVTIGRYDLQIAAIALAHNLTLVTNNVAGFGRVNGLVIEDWQKP